MILLVKALEIIAIQRVANLLHQIVVEIQIVQNRQTHAQSFLCLDQMADIRTAVIPAGRTSAILVDGTGVSRVFLVQQIHLAVPGEQIAVAGVTGRHNAVEEIHTAMHRFQNILRRTHAHQIAGLVLGHIGLHGLNDAVHFLRFLAHGQTADGISVQIHLRDLLHMADTQILVGAALVDAEQHLLRVDGSGQLGQSFQFRLAAEQPAGGAIAGMLYVIVLGGILNALVEGHGDGGSQMGLDPHTFLRAHKDALAVDMGGEIHALLLDAAQLGQREYLESTAVGEGGACPSAEFLQTAQLVDQSVAGTEVEVVGIGQHDLAVYVPQILCRDAALDGGTGGHVHKNGGFDLAVRGDQAAAAGFAIFFLKNKHI